MCLEDEPQARLKGMVVIMSKVNIHAVLKTQEKIYDYIVPAIYKEDEGIIIYKEKDSENTKTSFNYRTKELIRENASLNMNYHFNKDKNSQGTILIHGLGSTLTVTIKTIKLIRNDKNIEIEFLLEGQPFTYKIEVR